MATICRPWVLFAGFALLSLAVLAPTNYSVDGASMMAVADSLSHGHLAISCQLGVAGRHGACYSNWYPLLSFVAAPLVALGHLAASLMGLPSLFIGHAAALIVPALAGAVTATVTASLALRFGATRLGAVGAGAAVELGTTLLTYDRTFYAEPLLASTVALTLWGLTGPRRYRSVGLVAIGLTILTKPQAVLVGLAIAGALAICRRDWRVVIAPFCAAAASSVLYLAYNWYRFGGLMNFGTPAGAPHARSLALASYAPLKFVNAAALLTISPGRGFIWFSPVVIVGFIALWRARHSELAAAVIVVPLALLAVYVANTGGGEAWGSRYLVPALPGICASLGALRGRAVKVAVGLAVVGFLLQLPNLAGNFERYYAEQTAVGIRPAQLYWNVTKTPLFGVWSSAVHQVKAAVHTNVERVVHGPSSAGTASDRPVAEQRALNVMSVWWWMLPAAGIPRAVGASLSLLAVALGTWLLLLAGGVSGGGLWSRRRRGGSRLDHSASRLVEAVEIS